MPGNDSTTRRQTRRAKERAEWEQQHAEEISANRDASRAYADATARVNVLRVKMGLPMVTS